MQMSSICRFASFKLTAAKKRIQLEIIDHTTIIDNELQDEGTTYCLELEASS